MTKIKLNGSVRKVLGTAESNRLRKQGQLPCVIYNEKGENIYLSVEAREFNKEYIKGNIQIRPIEIKTKDKTYNVLVYGFDIHPVSDMPIHVDFLNTEGKKEVKVFIPLEIKGKEKGVGLKRGGFLNLVKRKIQVWCSPAKIPTGIAVDVSKLHIGETLKVEQIKFPEGCRPVNKNNFVVISITGRGKSTDEKPAGVSGEAVEGAEAPANGEVKAEEKK
jgi:large subunit ribosomal protein L25